MSETRSTNFLQFRKDIRDGFVNHYLIGTPESFSANDISDLYEVSNCSFEQKIEFKACIFTRPVVFKNCIFKGEVRFANVDFNQSIRFSDCTFEADLSFSGLAFERLTFERGSYQAIRFKGNINIAKEFPGEITFEGGNYDTIYFDCNQVNTALFFNAGIFENLYLSDGNYQGKFSVEGLNIKVNFLSIDSCSFMDRVDFKVTSKVGSLRLHRVTLNQMTIFHEGFSCDNISLESVIAKQRVSMLSNGNISGVNIGDCDFSSSFECSCYGDIMYSTDHHFSCDLSGVIRGNVLFENIVLSSIYLNCNNFGNLVFRNTDTHLIVIKDFLNFNRVTFANIRLVYERHFLIIFDSNVDKMEFVNVDFRRFEEIVIARSEVSNIILSNSVLPPDVRIGTSDPKFGYVIAADEKINDNTYYRENYRQLKLAMEKQGNIRASLLYKAKEMHYLRRETGWGWDKLLLYLNYFSNNHGLSWTRGVLFTLVSTALMYSLFLLSVSRLSLDLSQGLLPDSTSYAMISWLNGFAEFIASFPLYKKQSDLSVSWQSFAIIMSSRIIIGYGVYQTVAAFRKFAGK